MYESLVNDNLLIHHEEVDLSYSAEPSKVFKVIKPLQINFISYPYEWCFGELKDAALTTLAIQKKAFEYGMVLKDASAYNIQFINGRPVLIDTLSFEKYEQGSPWIAYRQFCQHFLGPLALMSYKDIRLSHLLRIYIDGIPLDLASSLMPFYSHFKIGLLMHIHLHARTQKRFAKKTVNSKPKMSKLSFKGLIDSLESAIKNLKWKAESTEWVNYYNDTNYTDEAANQKLIILREFLDKIGNSKIIWDLGANTGKYSEDAASHGSQVISFDIDPGAVEINYQEKVKKEKNSNILPLLIDLTNPSGSIGWANRERKSLIERGPADIVIALALIHHLAISNNVPFSRIADFFDKISRWLIIEYIPKNDSKVQHLLSSRKDIFEEYTIESFESAFSKYFHIELVRKIQGSERVLYLLRKS